MTETDLTKKIKNLKKIQPSQSWRISARHNLINRIRLADEETGPMPGFWGWMRQYQAAALAICILLNLIIGPWLLAKAAQTSLPGDLLYSVKKAGEQVRARVTSEDDKIQLQVEFANRRMQELDKISDNFAFDKKQEHTQKTKQVISDLKSNLTEASFYLKNNISKEKAVVVAKKTQKIKEDLVRNKEGFPLEARQELAEAEKAIEEIKYQILTVLMSEQEDNQDTATSSDEEILIFLKETDFSVETSTPKELIIQDESETTSEE